jgi:LPXTG-motif cell wall-anchored protein
MTAAEFKAAWHKMDLEDDSQGQVVAAKESATQTSGESSRAPLAVAVIIVIAGLLVALRKRKK